MILLFPWVSQSHLRVSVQYPLPLLLMLFSFPFSCQLPHMVLLFLQQILFQPGIQCIFLCIFWMNNFKISSVSFIILLPTEFDRIFCDIFRHGAKRKSGSASQLVKSWHDLTWILMFYKILILMLYADVNSETAVLHFPRYSSEYCHAVGAPLLRSWSLPPVLLSPKHVVRSQCHMLLL